jgi:uncharacterized caspase-like protein
MEAPVGLHTRTFTAPEELIQALHDKFVFPKPDSGDAETEAVEMAPLMDRVWSWQLWAGIAVNLSVADAEVSCGT